MDPKAISVISNNLEAVRKIVENKEDSTKKIFKDIINGDDVKHVVSTFIDEMEDIKTTIVELNTNMSGVKFIVKKSSELMSKQNNNAQLIEILEKISKSVDALLKKNIASPSNAENKNMLKNILGDVSKDKHVQTLLVASLMGKDVAKNLADVLKYSRGAKKGIKLLDIILFGDGKKNKGLIDILDKISKEKKIYEDSNNNIKLIAGCTKSLLEIALIMSGMVILAVPAMLGAVMTSLFVKVFLKTNKELIEHNKELDKGLVSMNKLMLGLVFMGLAMVLMFNAVKDVKWETFGMVIATVVSFSAILVVMGKLSKGIEKGAYSLGIMSASFISMGLGLLLMTKAVKDARWEDLSMIVLTVGVLSGILILMSKLSKNIGEGAISLAILSTTFLSFSISMMLMYNTIKNIKFNDFLIICGTVLIMGTVLVLMSKFSKDSINGAISMVLMSLSFLTLSLNMLIMYKIVKDVEWKQFTILFGTILVMGGLLVTLSMLSEQTKEGSKSLIRMSVGYLVMSLSMFVMYNTIKNTNWETFGMLAATIGLLAGVVVLLGALKQVSVTGSEVLVLMGTGYLLFSISMMLMYKSVEKASWEKFGMIVATIGSLAALTALMGIPVVAGLIVLGSISLGIMSFALITLALGVKLFGEYVTDNSIEKISKGIPKILEAMTSMFKSNKENPNFGDGILGLITGVLKIGGAIFAAGALMIIGISLGILAICLKPWENVNNKAIDNVEYTIGKLKKVFNLDNDEESKGLGSIGDGILGIVMAALNFGKTFFEMGSILLVSFTMGMIYDNIMKWKDFDKSSIKNFEDAYNTLRTIFKLDDDKNSGLGSIGDGILGIASAALSFGKTFFQMGTILMCVITMSEVYDSIDKWKNFDKKSISNFEDTYKKLKEIFKLDEKNESKGIGGIFKNITGMASAALNFGKTFFQMGIILMCVITMSEVYDSIDKWKNFDFNSINNFEKVYDRLKIMFKLDDDNKKGGISATFKNIMGMASASLSFGKTFFQMGTILMTVITMNYVYNYISKWKNFDFGSIDNFESAYNRLRDIFKFDDEQKSGISGLFGNLFDCASSMLKMGKTFFEMGIILISVHVMSIVKDNLDKWKDYDPKSLNNMDDSLNRLRIILSKYGDDDLSDSHDNIKLVSKTLNIYTDIVKKIVNLKKDIESFDRLMYISITALNRWNNMKYELISESVSKSLKNMFETIEKPGRSYRKNVDTSIKLFNTLNNLRRLDMSKISNPFQKITENVNRLNIEKTKALTDMFNSFSKVREKNIFSSFKDSVDEFTNACIQLIDAINGNTDALNSDDVSNDNETTTTSTTSNQPSGTSVRVTNIEELAQMIAERVGSGSRYNSGGYTTVDLRINGQGGDQWVIRKR